MRHQMHQQQQQQSLAIHPVAGSPLSIGSGFTGVGFRHAQFHGTMDPFVMVDHYTMSAPTFGAHPHAGIGAVSVLFEDTVGRFNNRDSLGNDFDIHPGDLYWLNAGKGAIHDEAPRKGAKIHGLQIFVNLPARLKQAPPSSLHVKHDAMPTLTGKGYRVRLVLGESNGISAKANAVWPVTILDGFADNTSNFAHRIQADRNAWLYAVAGELELQRQGEWFALKQGQACAITNANDEAIHVRGLTTQRSHFVLLSGQRINEPFVQQGPFVMSTQAQIDEVVARYQTGELGQLG